jgi:hypothetical protein
MKKITKEQVDLILNVMYSTNIPAQSFDQIKKLLLELPEVEEVKKK